MAWTTPKTWSTGETLTAANFNTHIRDNLNTAWHLLARKTADETIGPSTALQSDDHLAYSVGANEVWLWIAHFLLTASSNAGDFQYSWQFPASGAMTWFQPGIFGPSDAVTSNTGSITTSDASPSTLGADTPLRIYLVHGIYVNAGTAGTVTLRWAQNSASGTTTLKTNSAIIGMKLA